jgi:hypothetical protein
MANRYFKDHPRTLEGGLVKLYGHVVTSTSGTVSSQTSKGFTVTKTGSETGRYTVTLEDKYTSLRGCSVAVEGAADSAYTTAKGLNWFLRGVDVGAATPLLYIQFNRTDTAADAELEDAAEFYIELTLKNTGAY